MNKIYKFDVLITPSTYKETVLVEAEDYREAIKCLSDNMKELWEKRALSSVFYEYQVKSHDDITDRYNHKKYENYTLLSQENKDDEYYTEYGFNPNQLSIF